MQRNQHNARDWKAEGDGCPARWQALNTVLIRSSHPFKKAQVSAHSGYKPTLLLGCTKIYAGYLKKGWHKDPTEATGKTDLNVARNSGLSNPP